jgi:pimeloyl-ACP methyl ester carboxylesterase
MLVTNEPPRLDYLDASHCTFSLYDDRTVFTAEQIVCRDASPLTVLETGSSEQPTVLLVNALGMSCLFLAPIARRLGERYHVLTWESRGLPDERTTPEETDLTIPRHAEDAADVLAHKGRCAFAVVAFCSGSNVAIYALTRNLVNADHLCIISPSIELTGVGEKTDYQRTMLPIWRKIAESGQHYAALVRVLLQQGRRPSDGTIQAELAALNDLPFRTDKSIYRYARMQAACLELDWRSLLGELKTPTLVLHAEHDDLIHIETSNAVAAAVPGAQFCVTEGGHFAIHSSAALHDKVREFLQGH